MIRVYQFALRPPIENEVLARAQLRAAHTYRNQLVEIERGRRWALRTLEDTEAVRAATALLRSATRSDRKMRLADLREARALAREAASQCELAPRVAAATAQLSARLGDKTASKKELSELRAELRRAWSAGTAIRFNGSAKPRTSRRDPLEQAGQVQLSFNGSARPRTSRQGMHKHAER